MHDFSELNLIGQSPAFLNALGLLEKFAACDATVLIEGETGTGKELAARAIHYLSERRDYPFIPVNCGALPESLVESELFGHVRGAFTDARANQLGLVASAEAGTLFLDEIEALSSRGQVVLLRFLQNGEYRPVGSAAPRNADLRVVASSNADLETMVRSGRFRQDLLYRLNVLSVQLPPVRRRDGDARLLAENFVHRLCQQYGTANRWLHRDLLTFVDNYAWPGNVRELENFVHREFLLCERDQQVIRTVGATSMTEQGSGEGRSPDGSSFAMAKARVIARFEREYLEKALRDADGNVTLAARRSGKERRSFGKLLKKHGIEHMQQAAD